MKKILAALLILVFTTTAVAHANHDHTASTNSSDTVQQPEEQERGAFANLASETSLSSGLVVAEILLATVLGFMAFRHYYRNGEE